MSWALTASRLEEAWGQGLNQINQKKGTWRGGQVRSTILTHNHSPLSHTFISHPCELVLTLIIHSLSIIDQQSHSFSCLQTHYHHTLSEAKPTHQLLEHQAPTHYRDTLTTEAVNGHPCRPPLLAVTESSITLVFREPIGYGSGDEK